MPVISIDLWGTLIKSSPLFVEKKIELTKRWFPTLNEHYILKCYSDTKKEFNAIIESVGWQPTIKTIFEHLFNKLSGIPAKHSDEDIFLFIDQYQLLATIFCPDIYSNVTEAYLKKLHNDHELIISSNTMFISGETLIKTLVKNDICKYFKIFRFSDQQAQSKPHPKMFIYMNRFTDYHIGDNEITDGIGAKNAGSIPIIINSNNKTIKDAYDFIIQNK